MPRTPCKKPKFSDMVLFTDLHLQARNKYGGVEYWVGMGTKTIETATQVSLQHNKAPIVFLGDFFHYKDRHPAWLITRVQRAIQESVAQGIDWYLMLGNHDIGSMNASIIEVFGSIEGVKVIATPEVIQIGERKCGFIPFSINTDQNNLEKEINEFKGCDILFLHHGLEGAVTALGHTFEDGLGEKALSDFDFVICGHYHKHQFVFQNALYLGSPYQLDFGERDDNLKGVWFFDSMKEQLVQYPVPGAPRFCVIERDAKDAESVLKEDVEGKIVRVTLNGSKGEIVNLNIPELRKAMMAKRPPVALMFETVREDVQQERLVTGAGGFSWDGVLKEYGKQKGFDEGVMAIGTKILEKVRMEGN